MRTSPENQSRPTQKENIIQLKMKNKHKCFSQEFSTSQLM